MSVVDRYVLLLFGKIFAVCFVSLTGLFIIIHLFSNLDELSVLADKVGGMSKLLVEFYGPRVLDFFDRTVAVLILISGVCALAWMQRHREMTAVEAAGVPRSRMFRTILLGAVGLIVLSAVNREVWIPQFKDELVSTAQNWRGLNESIPNFQKDHQTGLHIRGEKLLIGESKIVAPIIQIPVDLSSSILRITAMAAWFVPANENHPAGLLLEDITEPANINALNDLDDSGTGVVFAPERHLWLKANQCFVASSLTVDEMALGQQQGDFSSINELMKSIRRPTQAYSHGNRIAIHARIIRPILDLTLLLITLPVALLFTERNLFWAAMVCVLIVAAVQLTTFLSFSLGSFSLIKSSALAAWIPLMVFLPLSPFTLKLLNR
jgi:lipopolysaccharide export system permease protein